MGEPAGIGPEIAVAAWRAMGGHIGKRALKLVGDASVLRAQGDVPGAALTESHALGAPLRAGHADSANTRAVVDAIDTAVAMAMQGAASAVVTAPIHKASLMKGGFEYPGHTEYLQQLTDSPRAVMMLAGGGLRVVPLTIHIPLSQVPRRISATRPGSRRASTGPQPSWVGSPTPTTSEAPSAIRRVGWASAKAGCVIRLPPSKANSGQRCGFMAPL